MKPLSGAVILDLTHMLSGPYCTMILADLGARTIKIEPRGGEGTRKLLATDPKNSRHGMGAYFLTLNRNKESVGLDLKHPDGYRLFTELAAKAHVVVNNFGPGVPMAGPFTATMFGFDFSSRSIQLCSPLPIE
jgi:crotonobetainyl-CoA:carnitine CoA-transferase CaiB-like acyl-CoA transferase